MKKLYSVLTFILLILSARAQNVWNQKADFMGSDREYAVGFSIGNFGYLGAGTDNLGFRKDFWKWDQTSNVWTQIADFGSNERISAVGFSMNGKGYVGTGAGYNGATADFWEYDPVTDTWTQKADFGGGIRRDAIGFSINGKGYLGTGTGVGGYKQDFWEYDPISDVWTQKANFAGGVRYGATGVAAGNKGYVGIGSPDFIPVTDFWEYDPLTDNWTQKANFLGPARAWAAGFSIGNRVFIGTGLDVMAPPYGAVDVWSYDVTNDSWAQVASFPDADVHASVGFSINTKGYIGTGNVDVGDENFFWEYSPTVGINEHTTNMYHFEIYPNPFSVSADIISDKNLKHATLSIYDLLGKEIRNISNLSGQKIHIDRENLTSGVYLVVVKEDDIILLSEKVFIID